MTLDDPILGQRYYHELHFFCSECGDPFLDPSKSSAPGTERNQDEEGETNPFVIQKGHPYCERCHLRLHKPKCKKCSNPIPDVAINAMGAIWHKECFTCTVSLILMSCADFVRLVEMTLPIICSSRKTEKHCARVVGRSQSSHLRDV